MSCDRNSKNCANKAGVRNGIVGLAGRYMNTLGSWSTYSNLESIEDIPERIAKITSAFFGVRGLLEGRPYVKAILGAILGLHLMEQATGQAATTGMRLFGRGEPVGAWRGVIVRKSPLTRHKAKILNRLTGGRVTDAVGYYFHEGGRTWHCQSFTVEMGGVPRTLTHIRSFSIPHREHFFDRPLTLGNGNSSTTAIGDDAKQREVTIQNIINIVKGDEEPATIPGYIGSTNEFENAGGLGYAKRALFMSSWFLIDESERDTPTPDEVDYHSLLGEEKKEGKAKKKNHYDVDSGGTTYYSAGGWPSTSGPDPAPVVVGGSAQPYGNQLFGTGTGRPPKNVTQTLRVDGKDRPLIINRIIHGVLGKPSQAEAIWWDEEERKWKMVDDIDAREELARGVAEGKYHVTMDNGLL
jgi:hypothetical protein